MVVIVDYDSGNVGSIKNMLATFGVDAVISRQDADLKNCKKIILPGVGSFDGAMRNLKNFGLTDLLTEQVCVRKKPFLGICLGMQLLAKHSEEGQLAGLGWVDATVKKFHSRDFDDKNLRIPHMGWKELKWKSHTGISNMLTENNRFYFVHSYHVQCSDESDIAATAHYGHEFTAAVHAENIYGVQFHPEKSHRYGRQLLKNFVSL